jgi:hypothetical protein
MGGVCNRHGDVRSEYHILVPDPADYTCAIYICTSIYIYMGNIKMTHRLVGCRSVGWVELGSDWVPVARFR